VHLRQAPDHHEGRILTKVTITTNIRQFSAHLKELQVKLPEMMSETVHEIGNAAYYTSQMNCPVKSGNLRLRSGVENGTPMVSIIHYDAPYAAYVEFGTGIYGPMGMPIVIVPIHKTALHWVDEGGDHFAKRVIIMGMPPRAFLRGAVEWVKPQASAIAGAVFDKYTKEMAS